MRCPKFRTRTKNGKYCMLSKHCTNKEYIRTKKGLCTGEPKRKELSAVRIKRAKAED